MLTRLKFYDKILLHKTLKGGLKMASFTMWLVTTLGTAALYIAKEMGLLEVRTLVIEILLGVDCFFLWVMCLWVNGGIKRFDKKNTATYLWWVFAGTAILLGIYNKNNYDPIAEPFIIIGIAFLSSASFVAFCGMLHSFRNRIGRILKCRKSIKDNALWLIALVITYASATGLFHHLGEDAFKWVMWIFAGIDYIIFCRIFYHYFIDLKYVEKIREKRITFKRV